MLPDLSINVPLKPLNLWSPMKVQRTAEGRAHVEDKYCGYLGNPLGLRMPSTTARANGCS